VKKINEIKNDDACERNITTTERHRDENAKHNTSNVCYDWEKSMCVAQSTVLMYRVAQKSKPLPNDQKNRIKACQWD